MKCKYCGHTTASSTGLCRTHKFARKRGAKRVREEGLVLNEAAPDAWWVFDKIGNVLVHNQVSPTHALVLLGLGMTAAVETFGDDDE